MDRWTSEKLVPFVSPPVVFSDRMSASSMVTMVVTVMITETDRWWFGCDDDMTDQNQ